MSTRLTLFVVAVMCAATFCMFASPLFSQTTTTTEFEEEARKDIERESELRQKLPWTQHVGFDYGGWMRISYYAWEDDPVLLTVPPTRPNERYMRELDARVWTSLDVYGAHNFYLRLKNIYRDYSSGDNPPDDPENRWDGLEIDQGYYSIDLGKLLREELKPARPLEGSLTIGRQFMFLGTGLAFNRVVDGLALTTRYGDFRSKLFGARSNHDEPDFDTSRPGWEHTRRTFVGGQVDYLGIQRHTPYFFYMRQSDHNVERTEVPQDFDYDSYYVGVGVRGELVKRLGYYAEHIWQGGKSTARNDFIFVNQREDISATAINVGLNYYPKWRFKPNFSLQYLHGSGDPDRMSVTNTVRGNLGDTDDENFLYFGHVFTGYSLAPRVSNINIIRLGASANFLEKYETFKDMEMGLNYFKYWKDERKGGISDFRAVVRLGKPQRSDIGDELDFYLNWRILSDLTFTLRFGTFWTGDAYEDDERRDFLALGLTLTF